MEQTLEQEIISVYDHRIDSFFTINQISKKLKKTYPYINKKVNSMINNEVLKKTAIGNSYLCSLNLKNERTIMLLTLNEVLKRNRLIKKDKTIYSLLPRLDKIKRKITIHTVFYSKPHIYFVLENLNDKESIKESIKHKTIFLNKKDFQKKILNNSLLDDYTVIYSVPKFFELIQEVLPQLKANTLFNA